MQGKYLEGISDLVQVVKTVPDPQGDILKAGYFRHVFELAGSLREYSLKAADPPLTRANVTLLDEAVKLRGETAKEHYRIGVQKVQELLKPIDAEIEASKDEPETAKRLGLDRRRLTKYATFNFDVVADFIKSSLND